jgi:hypothetical protein
MAGSSYDGEYVYMGSKDGIFFFNKIKNKKDYLKNLSDIMVIPGITDDK